MNRRSRRGGVLKKSLVVSSWILARSVYHRFELRGKCHPVYPRAMVRRADEVSDTAQGTSV
jgi:hypothetical protein